MDVGGFLKRISLALFAGLWAWSAGAAVPGSARVWDGLFDRPVRVRIARDQSRIVIQGVNLQVRAGTLVLWSKKGLAQIEIQKSSAAGRSFWSVQAPDGSRHSSPAPVIHVEGSALRKGFESLPNRLSFHSRPGRFDLVGMVPLEEYLLGVLSSEMPLSWPREALKAQAVAARSYTLAVMRERRRLHYDVENSVLDQVFRHVPEDRRSDSAMRIARQALRETAGVILLDTKGQVTKAFYHADCGGATSPARRVWGAGENSPVVVDASCPGHPRSNWALRLSREELDRSLRRKFALGSALEDLAAVSVSDRERATRISLRLADGSEKTVNAHEFREALGYSTLRSTFFTVEKDEGGFEFKGRGWGHGVGLCQWGTRSLAQAGQGADEILRHYYPRSRLLGEIRSSPAISPRRTAQRE